MLFDLLMSFLLMLLSICVYFFSFSYILHMWRLTFSSQKVPFLTTIYPPYLLYLLVMFWWERNKGSIPVTNLVPLLNMLRLWELHTALWSENIGGIVSIHIFPHRIWFKLGEKYVFFFLRWHESWKRFFLSMPSYMIFFIAFWQLNFASLIIVTKFIIFKYISC